MSQKTEPTMSNRRAVTLVAGAALAAATCLITGGLAYGGMAVASTDWGPVTTVWDHGFEDLSSVTTDNGMVVAAWGGHGFQNLWVSVRPAGQEWSQPTKIVTVAGGVTLAKDGKGAWVLWQGFDDVSALQIAADGSLGAPVVLGPSSDPFISDARIAVGSNGAVAAVWHQKTSSPLLAYRPGGGQWGAAETVPVPGTLRGLVVGSAGTAQLVLATDQGLVYLRRSAGGSWSAPVVVSTVAKLVTVAGDQHGDLVIGWQIDNGDGTLSLAARYRSAESGFGATQRLRDDVPYGTTVALAMARNGAVASAYQIQSQGSQQIQMTPADVDGDWLDPQTLSLTGSIYGIAMNSAGDFVVTSHQGAGLQLVRCAASDVCDAAESNPATAFRFPSTSLGPNGAITLVWGRGCHTEECLPTRLVAQRGH